MTSTPTPWYATGVHIQSAVINEDNYVCEVEGDTPEQAESNAALIVKAVNRDHLFEECVEALEEIANTVEKKSGFKSRQIARAVLRKLGKVS